MKKWNYVEKDGNPTKAGVYWVTGLNRPAVEVAKRSMPGSQWKILVFLICQKE